MVVSRPSKGLGPRRYASERTFSHDDTCGYVNGQGNGLYCNPNLEIGGGNGICGQFLGETEQRTMHAINNFIAKN